ncbi:hypothetical protein SARC_08250 [Sphaeroforma arctica JP610]|uniref:Uncharacterized protein n=1 Tax=Sphaeroforma arctica JP610 TaxID=667725 RepID=A0A0L0FTV9_9EUKA|nr:hypothetical protein SARC_08250 [Sphaeroforma arctica JP610]KNC79358.1 hypothetical protein SARC_08250 [Sphaeroforma arctica JP610]|eukprot:XP_014153260.1 hypothetical protein SARC_08250 [Sphaeroforma arctica JP610]
MKVRDAFEEIEHEGVEDDSELEVVDKEAQEATKRVLRVSKQQYEVLMKQIRRNGAKKGQHGARWLVPCLETMTWTIP